MAIVEQTAPAAALGELKAYLRLEDSREDALLAGFLRAATETVEAMLGVVLLEREIEERTRVQGGVALLRAEPVASLVGVMLVQADGSRRALEAGEAVLRVGLHEGGRLNCPELDEGSELVVRLRAGVARDWNLVPEILRLCVVRAAAHFHAHRDSAEDGGLPPAVRRMLGPWRSRRLK